ncbi:hypothetical protein KBC75_02075 [Candidatus Shapirobacteria bacterium]|nr:hypothetical protein [Candidatus Shapirobacteria bacterium]
MFDRPSPTKINDIPPPVDFFNDSEFNRLALEVVRNNLLFPETVDVLLQKVSCFQGGNKEDSQDLGTSFEEYERLAILDSISRTIGGDVELAQQIDAILFFDRSYGTLTKTVSTGVFGIRNDGKNFIGICKGYAYDSAPQNTTNIVEYLSFAASHETQHFKQWSEKRLDLGIMSEIHQHDQQGAISYQNSLPTPGVIKAINQLHVEEGVGHPLESEAQNKAIEVFSQMTYLHV